MRVTCKVGIRDYSVIDDYRGSTDNGRKRRRGEKDK
jgi:hypothetical protein